MTDLKNVNTAVSDISEQIHDAVSEVVERWARDGRSQVRSAIRAPDPSAIGAAFVAGAVVGAVLGIIFALMLAPKSGRALRDEIAERARQTDGAGQEPIQAVGER